MSKIKVLVVDDSAAVRLFLTDIIGGEEDMEVVGVAVDPIIAGAKMKESRPDVITLDVEMPRMDGLTFLEKLMADNPIPVVMVSSLTQHGSKLALRALELGAVDIVAKPVINVAEGMKTLAREIVQKVRAAASAKLNIRQHVIRAILQSAPESLHHAPRAHSSENRIIAIGSSTGGTEALRAIVPKLPETLPGVLIVQHMPPLFTKSFAESLNSVSRVEVREATDGERLQRGKVLIAPGNKHMTVKKSGAGFVVEVKDGPLVHFVRPSADVLFDSVAKEVGKNAVGVILTGMGEDGARGLLHMRDEGALTIAQNEETCIVFGMPGKAIQLGAAEKVLPLDLIPRVLVDHGF